MTSSVGIPAARNKPDKKSNVYNVESSGKIDPLKTVGINMNHDDD